MFSVYLNYVESIQIIIFIIRIILISQFLDQGGGGVLKVVYCKFLHFLVSLLVCRSGHWLFCLSVCSFVSLLVYYFCSFLAYHRLAKKFVFRLYYIQKIILLLSVFMCACVHALIHSFAAQNLRPIMAPQHSSPLRKDESKTDNKRRKYINRRLANSLLFGH